MVAAESNGGNDVFFVARNYDANRNLAIIGAVGRVEGATARVEADLSTKVAAESVFKRGGVEMGGPGRRRGDDLRHRVQNIFEDAGAGRKGRMESVVSQFEIHRAGVLNRLVGNYRHASPYSYGFQ